MASIASFVSAIAAPQAHSPHAERKGSVLAVQQRQCDEKRLSSSAVTDALLTLPFLEPPMVGYTCRASSVADSCPGLADAGLDSSGEPSAAAARGILEALALQGGDCSSNASCLTQVFCRSGE